MLHKKQTVTFDFFSLQSYFLDYNEKLFKRL